ncbi:unnamed protein product [Phyllotreta striolata]|uniref:Uncharacterized protein n=1 Tax=Phyllotreta striolata TaxID=444603 RepID=A0A9N9XQH8_PHYSR|nr:unnamed protein product [Phyllotreta striolata]
MSGLCLSSVFSILHEDHQWYLKPFDETINCVSDEINSECKSLVKSINSICELCTPVPGILVRKFSDQKAASIIKTFIQSVRDRRVFRRVTNYLKETQKRSPRKVLALANMKHARMFEANHFKLIFRLDGTRFPPSIVYKLIPSIELSIINLCRLTWVVESKSKYEVWHQLKYFKCSACKTTIKNLPMNVKKRKKKVKTKVMLNSEFSI